MANGCMYVLGGGTEDVEHLDTVEMFSLSTCTWSELSPMLTGRSFEWGGAVEVGGSLYVFGGKDREGQIEVERIAKFEIAASRSSELNVRMDYMGGESLGYAYAVRKVSDDCVFILLVEPGLMGYKFTFLDLRDTKFSRPQDMPEPEIAPQAAVSAYT